MAPTAPTTQPNQKPQQRQQQQGRRPRPKSRYGQQLAEKQQLKEIYGLREEQLRKYYRDALKNKQETGPYLVSLLERRLDNAIFRAGFAVTRPQARQMASHSLFAVNGHPVTIPSIRLKKGDVVTVKETKRAKSYFSNFDKRMQNVRPPSWLTINPVEYSFTVVGEPSSDEAGIGVDVRAVLEFFTR
jgi:small subunit ribosomal protein S4